MSMNKLISEVKECIEREYGRAGANFGLTNHSDHESYAVILEEFQEASSEMERIRSDLEHFWYFTMHDYDDEDKAKACHKMWKHAMLAACELIQVSAMAQKALITVCDRGAVTEFRKESGGSNG